MQLPAPVHPSAPPLADFLRRFEETGEAQVHPFGEILPADDPAAEECLRAWDAAAREELSGPVPPFDPAAALWAARMYYQACQLLVCRDVPPGKIPDALAEPCPVARGPGADFSVDLVFRHLPELHAYARRAAPEDALVPVLAAWAHA